MNKICTNIKQSKSLIELGIDLNTADMYYMYRPWEIDKDTIGSQSDASIGFDISFYNGADNGKTYHYIPAWSLATLVNLLPFHLIVNNQRYSFNMHKGLNRDGETYMLIYNVFNTDVCLYSTDYYNNPVDAAFEMICWLKSEKYI